MTPSPDVLWAAFLAACGAVVAWALQSIIQAREAARQLTDHIAECDKRQLFVMRILTLIANKMEIKDDGKEGRLDR